MHTDSIRKRWVGTAIAALGIFLLLALRTHAKIFPSWDGQIWAYFQEHASVSMHRLMLGITLLGRMDVVFGITGAMLIVLARRKQLWPGGWVMVMATGGGVLVVNGAKALFPRPRALPGDAILGSSFPSGHVFLACTLSGLLAYWATRDHPQRRGPWIAAGAVTLLVGVSRVSLGAHYPTDVLAGFCLAVPWLTLWVWVLSRFVRTVPPAP